MRVIIGSYRGPEYVNRALVSLLANVAGISELIIVDDSGNSEWLADYESRSFISVGVENGGPVVRESSIRVVSTGGGRGYNTAMKLVCQVGAAVDRFMFWEEDFNATGWIDLNEMEAKLEASPDLAQLALQRQAWFPVEVAAGGMLAGLAVQHPDMVMERRGSVIVQDRIFTCNPAVWQQGIAALGWPDGQWSENSFSASLRKQGWKFGFLDTELVHHDGVRSGTGY
jgi:hypothetical protein